MSDEQEVTDMQVDRALEDNREALHTMIVFRHAHKTLVTREMPVLHDYGLTPAQFGVLDVLRAKGKMKIGHIIDSLFMTPGNMTVVIRNMERDGLIKRSTCENDKRVSYIELTQRGRKLINKALYDHAYNVGRLMRVLSSEEQEQLTSLLKKFKIHER
ncbi:MAG: MarR family transcriptional regulator [Actinomycetaceae bacterium]|nr:MarR family transcriptional regulator [Actinomycetaceae bacterium]